MESLLKQFLLCLLFSVTFLLSCANNILDVEDILDDKFMPGNLLLLEGTETYPNTSVKSEIDKNIHDGSILEAINTMGFHRQKMNEYLCRSYIAGQILSDMSFSRVRRRLGEPLTATAKSIPINELPTEKSDIKEALLADEGSLNYKHWLKKSLTLEELYRQLKERDSNEKQEDIEVAGDNIDNEYVGEVSGYAVPMNHVQDRQKIAQFSSFGHSDISGYGQGGFGHSGSGQGHSGYGHSAVEYADHGPVHPPVHQVHYTKGEGGKSKDLILSNLFEIALTAIAFLSFGCFVLQVIMCITYATTNSTLGILTRSSLPDDVPLEGNFQKSFDENYEPIKLRIKRSKAEPNKNNLAINELSRRVLLSMESAIVAEEDNANCLRRKLCEDNRYSRNSENNQKLWIPLWSFGMSWLSGRIGLRIPASTAMLDSLKASILGLGNANCERIYSNCTLETLRENRRKRRSA